MATKERYQNAVVGDSITLKLFVYNSNNRANVSSIEKVDIYYLDEAEVSEDNPNGKRLIESITDITTVETGLYSVTVELEDLEYVIGNYIDEWSIVFEESEPAAVIENRWRIFPDLWYTTPIPIAYDFRFKFSPNKVRIGEKRYLIIDIIPNVPTASDLAKYYENLAISSNLSISIEQACGDCIPAEADLRLAVDEALVEIRDGCRAFYMLDTDGLDLSCGIYNVWFKMAFGDNIYISNKQQLQIHD